jgi:hypothetical protein
MKKFISIILVFSLLILSGNLYAKGRRGTNLIITKKNGSIVKGELIAVKENSLLLKESKSAMDRTVEVSDIAIIKKRTKIGAYVGGFLGALAGYPLYNKLISEAEVKEDLYETLTQENLAYYFFAVSAFFAVGALAGHHLFKTNEVIRIE